MRLVLIESPFMFRAEDPVDRSLGLLRNVTYARLAVRDCGMRGEAAYASHLFFTQPFILDDDIPEERQLGIDMGLAWGQAAEATVIYGDLGVSRGMDYGIRRAQADGRPVEQRSLPGWESALQERPADTLLRLGLYTREQLREAVRGGGPLGPLPAALPTMSPPTPGL